MPDEERWFLEVLTKTRWPDSIRLVYADYLDEHDQPIAARQIREHILWTKLQPVRVPIIPRNYFPPRVR